MAALRIIVNFFASISIVLTFVTTYLSWNKTWGVKHEPSVASSISMSSTLIAAFSLVFATLGVLMDHAWMTLIRYVLALASTVFFALIGAGWWVEGQRRKGLFGLIRESLRNERDRLGDLARSILHPASADALVDVLVAFALVDDALGDAERGFVDTFAEAWGVRIDWQSALARRAASREERLAGLRTIVERYLATSPPDTQVAQVAEILRRLAAADNDTSADESLMMAEVSGLLDKYLGAGPRTVYEVHLVPQSAEQQAALEATFPNMQRRTLPSGPVVVAGRYYSQAYAEVVRRKYVTLQFYTAVAETVDQPAA